MNNAITRHAVLDDVANILPLFESYRAFYGQASRASVAKTFLSERWILGESKLIVAEIGEQLVGFTQLFPSFSSVTLQRLWILNELFVTESARGRGIGHKLLRAAAQFGKTTQAKQLFIEGAVTNTKARSLYEDFGFIPNKEYVYYHLPL